MTDLSTLSGGACASLLLLPPGAQRAWLLAGNATFTLVSNRTGARYTYKIRRDKLTTAPHGKYSVLLLTGPDNEDSFTYLGSLWGRLRQIPAGPFDIEEEYFEFHRGKRCEYAEASAPVRVFRWMWYALANGRAMSADDSGGAKLLHCGRCGRCGRLLTVPESIESGYGPECVSKVNPNE